MPNWMRVAVPGGDAIAFVGDVSIAIAGGATATIPGGVFATLSGSPALATTTTYYVTYVTTAAPSVLLACRQQDFAAIYAAADVVAIGYHTDHYDLRLPVSIAIAGGLVARLVYKAHFNSDGLLTSIRVSAGSARTTTGTTIPFAVAYLPVPGGVAGTYLVCVSASGVLSLAAASPVGSFPIAQVQIMARPTNTFDQHYRNIDGSSAYITTPDKLFENGATIVAAAGIAALPSTAYRTDDHTPDFFHRYDRYYTSPPPSDGAGGTVAVGGTTVAVVANKMPPIPNSPSWADPLCYLQLIVSTGDVGGRYSTALPIVPPQGPSGVVNVAVGDFLFNTTSTLLFWQTVLQYVPGPYGTVYAPLPYIGIWHNLGTDSWTGADVDWVTAPGALLLAEYMAP